MIGFVYTDMSDSIEAPKGWVYDTDESDDQLAKEHDTKIWKNEDLGLVAIAEVVKEKSHRLDFYGEISDTSTASIQEYLWLSSDDYETEEETKEELVTWLVEQMGQFE